jgi:cytochrome c556
MKPGCRLGFLLCLVACSTHSEPSAPHQPASAANPVQHEMLLLTAALQSAVHAIGAGDVRDIAHQLHGVHAAKEQTEAALSSGSYRLRKNHERLGRFRALDQEFHGKLEGLVHASQENDVSATASAFAAVIQSCAPCHAEFRP